MDRLSVEVYVRVALKEFTVRREGYSWNRWLREEVKYQSKEQDMYDKVQINMMMDLVRMGRTCRKLWGDCEDCPRCFQYLYSEKEGHFSGSYRKEIAGPLCEMFYTLYFIDKVQIEDYSEAESALLLAQKLLK